MADQCQIATLNMLATSAALGVTEGIASDGTYLYVTPHDGYIVAKIDPGSFTIVDTLDLSEFDAGLTGLLGSFVAGGYLYILPHLTSSGPVYQDDVVRVDLANFTAAGCATLSIIDATETYDGSNGMTDGTHGYLNVQCPAMVTATRFGLGANFTPDSVETVSITEVEGGYPVYMGNLVAVDDEAAYFIATVTTFPGTGHGDRTMDLWLVTVPTANFTAGAATSQRLTDQSFLGNSIPVAYTALDDGNNLWTWPIPILAGPMANSFIGVMQIPKANPAAVTINQGPAEQPFPSSPLDNGAPAWDGARYGYLPSGTEQQILQLDTQAPGTVNIIDISEYSAGYPMWGMGYDGEALYAVSFSGGAGLCLQLQPMQASTA